MKKVLMIGLSSNNGGVETSIINMIKRKNNNKEYSIEFLNSSRKKIAFFEELNTQYRIYNITNYYDNSDKYCKELMDILTENKYDYIYINLCSAKHLEPVKVAKKYSKSKIIIHAHCINENNDDTKEYLTNSGDHLFACSKEVGDSFFSIGNYKIVTPEIGNNFIENKSKRKSFRKKLEVDNYIVLGQVGKFCDNKNQMFAIHILEQLVKRNSNYRLILVGKPNQKIEDYIIENNLNDYIILTGVVDNVNDYLNIFDIFLFPSKKEGYGISLVEAQQYTNLHILSSSTVSKITNVSGKVKYLDLNISIWCDEIINLSKGRFK